MNNTTAKNYYVYYVNKNGICEGPFTTTEFAWTHDGTFIDFNFPMCEDCDNKGCCTEELQILCNSVDHGDMHISE